MPRLKVKIYGLVQGVFFRGFIKEQATVLGLKGWVKNSSDGTVEAVFEGDEAGLKKMADWCRQGPPAAAVEKVKERWGEERGEFNEFEAEY